MASNFLIRPDCMKQLKSLCEGNHWATAFALGTACQLLDLEGLNEVVEAVQLFSGLPDIIQRTDNPGSL